VAQGRIGRTCVVLLVMAAGCTDTTRQPDLPELTWAHLKPITLDVASIEIIDATEKTGAAPHVEHLFPLPPEKAAERWARDRLRAGGLAGTARFIVRQAGVVEVELPRTQGLAGLFTRDQSERYDAVLDALLEVRDDNGRLMGQVESVAQKSRSVVQDASLYERQQEWFAMTDDLMRLFNAGMEGNIPTYLGPWVMRR
jgi:hypothetical protein